MTTQRVAHLRLLPVAMAAWAAALCATLAPGAAPVIAATAWTACLTALLSLAVSRRQRNGDVLRPRRAHVGVILVFALAAAAGAASHVALAQPARDDVAHFALSGGRALTAHATVVGKVERRATGEWAFDAHVARLITGSVGDDVGIDVTVRVQPSDVDRADLLDVGATVEVDGTARPAPSGDRAVLTVEASRGVRVTAAPQGVLAIAADLRRGLVGATAGLPAPGAGLIPGLAVGDTSAVSAELDTDMKESSLSHLTAVSGANCAIVVGIAFGAASAAGGSRRIRIGVGVVALACFVLLVTPEPSVVRAGAMAGVAMLGVLLGRTGVGSAVLALAVTVLLVADPWLAGSLGFALSAVATASLLLFARPLAAGLERWMPRSLALALAVPLAAQLACGPLLVVITPTAPLYGVVANLLAAPAAPVATIVGLAACLVAPLPWVQSGLTAIAWLPAAWIAGTAQTVSSLPGDQIPWWEGWPGVAGLAVVSVAIGTVVGVARTTRRRTRLVRVIAGLVLTVVAGVVAGGAALTTALGRLTLPSAWSIIACDVGQGDAVLIRSDAAVALVDAGPDPALLGSCLTRVGIERIDLLVITHFDLDHVGGIDAVVGRVNTALHGPVSGSDGAIVSELRRGGAHTVPAHAGMTGSLGDTRWRVVWPPAISRAFPGGNDASIVMDVRGGGVPTSLFLGDLSASPQRALASSGALSPPYDLVKVAHHGSADQYAQLYARARSAVALVTVGEENTYGHPRQEILNELHAIGARIARTDEDGLIALWRAGSDVLVWRERGPDVVPAG